MYPVYEGGRITITVDGITQESYSTKDYKAYEKAGKLKIDNPNSIVEIHTGVIRAELEESEETDLSKIFDHHITALDIFTGDVVESRILNGIECLGFKDQIGNINPMLGDIYNTELYPSAPVRIDNYIHMPVLRGLQYAQPFLEGRQEQPYTEIIVSRGLDAVPQEFYHWSLREHIDQMEIIPFIGESIKQDTELPKNNVINIFLIQFNGSDSFLEVNGNRILEGNAVTQFTEIFGYGTVSHCKQQDFFELYFKKGVLTDIEKNKAVNELNNKYQTGAYDPRPQAHEINIIPLDRGFFCNYEFYSELNPDWDYSLFTWVLVCPVQGDWLGTQEIIKNQEGNAINSDYLYFDLMDTDQFERMTKEYSYETVKICCFVQVFDTELNSFKALRGRYYQLD